MKPATPPSDSEIQHTLAEARTMEDAPEAVIRRALGVWRPRRRADAQAEPGALRRFVARLVQDSFGASGLALGLRAGEDALRQMLFDAGIGEVDLRIAPAEGLWQLRGQWLGEGSGGQATLVAEPSGDTVAQAPLNPLSEFHFPPLAAGHHRLVLEIADTRIELPPFEVGDTAR